MKTRRSHPSAGFGHGGANASFVSSRWFRASLSTPVSSESLDTRPYRTQCPWGLWALVTVSRATEVCVTSCCATMMSPTLERGGR